MQPWVRNKPPKPPMPKAVMPKASNGSPTPVKLPKSVNSQNVSKSKK
jgi:hypothetical protein